MRWSTGAALRRLVAATARTALVGAVAAAVAAVLVACERSVAPTPAGPPRIVSLSPAMTATVARLGLADHVVGRTPWCDSVDPGVPVVGSLTEFDAERLVRLAPTHLLVQPPRAGIDPGLERLAAAHGWTLIAHPIDGVDDIEAVVFSLPPALAEGDSELEATLTTRARAIVDEIAAAMHVEGDVLAQASPVLLLFSLDPPMAFGAGSYLGDMLERMGGRNAISANGYPQLSLEDIHRAAPRSIVLVRAEPADAVSLADPWAPLRGLDLVAIAEGRCALLRDPSAHTPGPDVAVLARRLAEVLRWGGSPRSDDPHPAAAPPTSPASGRGDGPGDGEVRAPPVPSPARGRGWPRSGRVRDARPSHAPSLTSPARGRGRRRSRRVRDARPSHAPSVPSPARGRGWSRACRGGRVRDARPSDAPRSLPA